MTEDVRDYVIEKSKALMEAPTCSQEAKDAAQAWIDAAGTDREAEETKKYVAELEEELDNTDETAGQDTPLSRENVLTGHVNEVGSAQPDTVILDTSELVTVVA